MQPRMRIVVVDDHPIIREGIRSLLSSASFVQALEFYDTCDAALAKFEDHPNQIVVLDVALPGRCPFEAAATINRISPLTRIAFFTGFLSETTLMRALQAKAAGFITKSDLGSSLVLCLETLASGGTYFCPAARRIIDRKPNLRSATNILTPRELELISYVARGLSSRDIAKLMHISVKTVARHKENISRKIGAKNSVQMAHYAYSEKIANL